MLAKIKKWYAMGLWTKTMVENAALKGVITREEAEEMFREEKT